MLVAIFGYINHRFIHLPDLIGIAAIGMTVSLFIVLGSKFESAITTQEINLVSRINFAGVLLHGILGLLLFAVSLQIRSDGIAQEKWTIIPLTKIGVIISTIVIGIGFYFITHSFLLSLPFIYYLLFGALISPTYPIAVLTVMRKVGVPKSLETRISGESLFNDGIGVVVFLTVLSTIEPGGDND
ncbi:MAG: cation:proton antiporter [Methylophilaceae bacterium]|nr:cation:proton antiporter [Methylophilaceae bacterium]